MKSFSKVVGYLDSPLCLIKCNLNCHRSGIPTNQADVLPSCPTSLACKSGCCNEIKEGEQSTIPMNSHLTWLYVNLSTKKSQTLLSSSCAHVRTDTFSTIIKNMDHLSNVSSISSIIRMEYCK